MNLESCDFKARCRSGLEVQQPEAQDLSTGRAFTLDNAIVNVINALHSIGIVHQDIGPNNILISKTPSNMCCSMILDPRYDEKPGEGGHGFPFTLRRPTVAPSTFAQRG